MKKTITLAALALGLATAAFAETTYTLGDITYTTTTTTGAAAADGANNCTGFTFTLNYASLNANGFSTAGENSSGETVSTLPSEGTVALSSIRIMQRYNTTSTKPAQLVITEVGNADFTAIVSTNFQAITRNDQIYSGYTRDFGVWTFDTASALLTVGKTYKVDFQNSTGTSQNWALGLNSNSNNSAVSVNNYTSYMPAGLLIETKSTIAHVAPGTETVPEPTSATLSLLALAGLTARRRRK